MYRESGIPIALGAPRDFAEELVDGRGVIVMDFFDVGCSRRLPWPQRPQAAPLLAALAEPARGFDAIGLKPRDPLGQPLDRLRLQDNQPRKLLIRRTLRLGLGHIGTLSHQPSPVDQDTPRTRAEHVPGNRVTMS